MIRWTLTLTALSTGWSPSSRSDSSRLLWKGRTSVQMMSRGNVYAHRSLKSLRLQLRHMVDKSREVEDLKCELDGAIAKERRA